MGNLRARLKNKKRRTTTYDMVVVDNDVLDAAEAALIDAQRDLRRAKVAAESDDDAAVELAETAVAAAKQELEQCRDTLVFQSLPSHEFEALISAHEPTKEQQSKGDQWNSETFSPALIAACCVDGDLTEDEWAEELRSERWSVADRNAIFSAALSANVTPRSVTVPKG